MAIEHLINNLLPVAPRCSVNQHRFQDHRALIVGDQISDRVYVEQNNHRRLGDVSLFTIEPHIRAKRVGSKWGIKHENVYFFTKDGRLEEL